MKKTLPIIFFFFFLTTFLFIINRKSNFTALEKSYIYQPTKQLIKNRIWRDIKFTKTGISKSFISSSFMSFGLGEIIYLGDEKDYFIKIYDVNANLIDSLGLGKGRGPGEFLDLYSTLLDQEGNVWINDRDNGRVTVLDIKNKGEWKIINPEVIPIATIPIDSGKYVLDQLIYGTLHVYSSNHELIGEYEPFLKDSKPWIIVLQGKYATAKDFSVVKSFIYTNNFIRYSKYGEILYFREPIAPPTMASIIRSPESNDVGIQENIYDFRSAEQFTAGINIVNESIHPLISKNKEYKDGYSGSNVLNITREFVDVYDLKTGDYLYSYKLPEAVSDFAVSEKFLATISEELGRLVVWEVKDSW